MSEAGFNTACSAGLVLLPILLASAGCASLGPQRAAGPPFPVFATVYRSNAATPSGSLRTEGRHFIDETAASPYFAESICREAPRSRRSSRPSTIPTSIESSTDGWNGEDFSIIASEDEPRSNYVPRPYPRRIAGTPTGFRYPAVGRDGSPEIEFAWENRPERGDTEIHLPRRLLPGAIVVEATGPASFERDGARQVLICRAPSAAPIAIRLRSGSNRG